jgi:hypothetical protein
MGLFEFLFGAGNDGNGRKLEEKLDQLSSQLKKLEATQRDSSYKLVKEVRDLRGQEVGGREEVLKRVESIQEKLQFAVEEYVTSDEDVKQMIRNCLKSRAKTFNELQKETKISPQSLHKYLRMMKNEVEEFNGVYRIVLSSSLVYVNKEKAARTVEDDKHLLELVEADAVYGAEFEEPAP